MTDSDKSKIENLDYEEVDNSLSTGQGEKIIADPIGLVGHVKARAEVILGTADISVDELYKISKGSVVSLNEDVNSDVTLVIEGKAIAHGQLVAVDEKFGIEITKIL